MLGWRVKETDGKRVRYLLYIEPTPLSSPLFGFL